MVVKPYFLRWQERFWFESCVVLDGSQTSGAVVMRENLFESCVVLDGSQTNKKKQYYTSQFESCVVLDGSQTFWRCSHA